MWLAVIGSLRTNDSIHCPNLLNKRRFDFRNHHVNRHGILRATWYDNISPMFAWLDEFEVHRFHRAHVLAHNGIDRSCTLQNIAPNPSDESLIRICVEKDLDIHQISQRPIDEDKNSLNDDDLLRIDTSGLG